MVYNGDNGYYKGAQYITAPNNGMACDILSAPLSSAVDANPTFISPDLLTFPTVSYEITFSTGTSGTLTVFGNNSGRAGVGEQLSSAAISGTTAIADFPSFGYKYLILQITTLSGTVTDVLIVGKR